jgi:hypothetical protein
MIVPMPQAMLLIWSLPTTKPAYSLLVIGPALQNRASATIPGVGGGIGVELELYSVRTQLICSWLIADPDPEKTSSIRHISLQGNRTLERLSLSESHGPRPRAGQQHALQWIAGGIIGGTKQHSWNGWPQHVRKESKLRLGRENAVLLPPFVHRSLHSPCVVCNALGVGIPFQCIIHLLLMQIQLLTQLIHVSDLLLPGLPLIRIQTIHQLCVFLLHFLDLIPNVDLLLINLTRIEVFPGILRHLPRLFADIIGKLVAGSNLVLLLFSGFDAFLLHLSARRLSAALALAHRLRLTLPLTLALAATAAFSTTLSLRECSWKQKQKHREQD